MMYDFSYNFLNSVCLLYINKDVHFNSILNLFVSKKLC